MGNQPAGGDAVPKLTIGQRLLTALPRVGGNSAPAASSPTLEDEADDRVDEIDEEAETPASPGARTTPARRNGAGPASPASTRPRPDGVGKSGMTKEQLVVAIKRLDDRERLFGFFMAPLGIAIGILSMVNASHMNAHTHLAKGALSKNMLIDLGVASIVLSVVVFFAALSRRRSFLGFALVFLGTSFGFPLLLPFWFVGGWLVFRAYKWQKELSAMGGGPAGRAASSGRAQASRSDPRARGRSAAEARAKKKQPAPKGPGASKRYTPPKPTRPRPPVPPA